MESLPLPFSHPHQQVWLQTTVLRDMGQSEPWWCCPRGILLKQPAENGLVETYPMTIRCLQKEQTKKAFIENLTFFQT